MTELEEKIVKSRKSGNTYGGIQIDCGNPSKKLIRKVLMEYCPELAGDLSQKELDKLFEQSLQEND